MRRISASRLPGAVKSRGRSSYFSELRYSSLPCLHRDVLEQLVPAVNAVERRQRRGEQQPNAKRRPAAVLEILVEDVGRVREEIRPVVLEDVRRAELRHPVAQLVRRVLPREVRVRLREAELGEVEQLLGTRERLREEDDVGIRLLQLADRPLPERERLRVRIVHAERAHAARHPEAEDVDGTRSTALPDPPSRSSAGRCPDTSWADSPRTGWCRRDES